MKKFKQIAALIGIIILVLLYVLTIVAAIFDNSNTMHYLAASIGATIIVPVFLWVIKIFIGLSNQKNKPPYENDNYINTSNKEAHLDK